MASDDKNPPGRGSIGEGAAEKPKRPSRVIDLEASEVEPDEKPDAEPGRAAENEGDKAELAAKAEDTYSKAAPAASAAPGIAPRRAKPSDIKGFVTHLAAGLAGGLMGVVGAGMVLEPSAPEALSGVQQEIQKLGQRLDALDVTVAAQKKPATGTDPAIGDAVRALNRMEARLGVIEARPEVATPAGLSEKMDDISGKLEQRTASLGEQVRALKSALDARPAAQGEGSGSQSGAPDLQPLRERLEKLEAALQALPAHAAGEDTSGAAASPALTMKVDDVSRKLEQRTASIGQDIEVLRSEIAKIAARPVAPVANISSKTDGAALSLAFDMLRRTVDRGEPFSRQLRALKEAAPEGLDLSALSSHADAGIRTDGALLADLAPALRAARQAATRSDDETFLNRLVANARSVVRVRRVGQTEGSDAAAVLSRMEAHMKAANFPGVLKEADRLSGPARTSLQPWLDAALAKRAVQTTLAEFERGLLAGLQSDGGAGKSR